MKIKLVHSRHLPDLFEYALILFTFAYFPFRGSANIALLLYCYFLRPFLSLDKVASINTNLSKILTEARHIQSELPESE